MCGAVHGLCRKILEENDRAHPHGWGAATGDRLEGSPSCAHQLCVDVAELQHEAAALSPSSRVAVMEKYRNEVYDNECVKGIKWQRG